MTREREAEAPCSELEALHTAPLGRSERTRARVETTEVRASMKLPPPPPARRAVDAYAR